LLGVSISRDDDIGRDLDLSGCSANPRAALSEGSIGILLGRFESRLCWLGMSIRS
jgi:hypothetical protein